VVEVTRKPPKTQKKRPPALRERPKAGESKGPHSLLPALAAVVLVLGVAAFLLFRGAGTMGDRPRNVLLITLDTVRADRLGAYGYAGAETPHLDALAARGVRFDDAVAPSPITGPSHAAMFTGLYPGRLGVRDNATTPLPDDAVTLAALLRERGFATGGFIGAFILDRPYGFANGFEHFGSGFERVESGREMNAERRGDAVVDDALAWLGSLPADRPFFGWVHLYDAHAEYAAPEPFGSQFRNNPYDGEIAFVDAQVGRLLDALRARGTFDDTLVIAIADHGEALGDHGEDEHGVFLYDEVIRIPWIAAGPGARPGHVVSEQVRAIDLMPTILDALGLDVPAELDGEPLTALLRGGAREEAPPAYAESHYPRLHYGWSELRAIRAEGWKAVAAPRPELYNLREDPGELHNLYGSRQALADRMIDQAARLGREMDARAAPVRAADRETLERLQSLGYVGIAAPPAPGTRLPDPKDRIHERREYRTLMTAALDALGEGRLAEAERALRRLAEINERAPDVHQLLGEVYQRQGRLNEALGAFEASALLNPSAAGPLLSAAEVHLQRRDLARARARLDDAARVDPQSFDVALVRGRVFQAEGRLIEALAAYERAAELNPANPGARLAALQLASELKRFGVAEAQARHLLEIGYQPARTHVALGQLAEMQGRVAEAERHYQAALALEPGLPMAHEALQRLSR
jgi:arylsulfatase A-like enzyme/Tfp pilus assembly protein PilF